MTARQAAPNRRLAALFLAATVGVLVSVGLVVAELGWLALGAYCAAVLVGLALLARRARALAARGASDGTTCTCCTSTVYDPVEVR